MFSYAYFFLFALQCLVVFLLSLRDIGTYNTLSNYLPAFPSVFGNSDDDEEEDDYEPIRRPKLKKSPLFNRYSNHIPTEEKNNRWYDKFFLGSGDSDEPTTPTPPVKIPPPDPGFFDWISNSGEISTEKNTDEQNQPKPQPTEQGIQPFVSFWGEKIYTNFSL